MDPRSVVTDLLADVERAVRRVPDEPLGQALDLLLDAQTDGRTVYAIGNGGSAATASHFVCDLSKTARVPGQRPLRAFALADNVSVLTAWANDLDYSQVFAEQLEALIQPDDVVIAISVSGSSPNVVAGLAAAKINGARTIGLLGCDGGEARALVDVAIHIPSRDYGVVEAVHLAILHGLTKAIRRTLEEKSVAGLLPAASDLAVASAR